MKLKTLKDIKLFLGDMVTEEDVPLVGANKIRQEAIKWIKELDTKNHLEFGDKNKIASDYFYTIDSEGNITDTQAGMVLRSFIKYFFNIKESGLK